MCFFFKGYGKVGGFAASLCDVVWFVVFYWQYINIYFIESVGKCVSACTYVHTFTFPFAVYKKTVRNPRLCSCQFLFCVCTLSTFKHPACTDMVECLLTFLPVQPADHTLAKIYIIVFFQRATLAFASWAAFTIASLSATDAEDDGDGKRRAMLVHVLVMSRWVLVLSPCHCWRVGFAASLCFFY